MVLMRSEEYKAAMKTMMASGKRAIRTFVRILRFACQETHLGHPSPMPQPTSVISKGVGRSLLRKLGRWKLAELSVWRKPSYFQLLPIRRGEELTAQQFRRIVVQGRLCRTVAHLRFVP